MRAQYQLSDYFTFMNSSYLLILIIITLAAIASVKAKKLTAVAAITGWLIAMLVFAGTGYAGVIMMAVFFVLATIATSIGLRVKQRLGVAERDKGRRTAGQVFANAGVAGLISLLIYLNPANTTLYIVMVSASLASATADTLSSELGNVYGRKFYNIVSFKKDKRGLDGVVSLEGTLTGIAGSAVIATIYALYFGLNIYVLHIIISGTIGNLSDSYLGATLERKEVLNNNAVNFLNTFIAAIAALILYSIS